LQLLITCAGTQWFHDVEFEIAAKARPQLPVARKAKFVATLAKVKVGHRANKTDPLLAAGNLIIRGGSVRSKLRLRNQTAIMRFDPSLRLNGRNKIFFVEDFSRADGHHFNKTQDQITRRGKLSQRNQLILISPAHQDGI